MGALVGPWAIGAEVQVESVGCPPEASGAGFVVYDASAGPIKGWSHVAERPESFPLAKLAAERYAVDGRSLESDVDCGGEAVFRTVLVRKMSNWGQQHVNGLEPVFFETPLAVESVEAVVFWIKFNSAESSIADAAALAKHYDGHLEPEQIAALDGGLACISVALLEAGYNEQETETLHAVVYLEFDPATDFDRWLLVTAPVEAFQFGFERRYALRKVEAGAATGRSFVALRINPETSGGIVARNFLGESWDDSVPELYKEMSVSLRRIEVRLKDE